MNEGGQDRYTGFCLGTMNRLGGGRGRRCKGNIKMDLKQDRMS
jgi:hypothetical protein